jgi:hypothetical protein
VGPTQFGSAVTGRLTAGFGRVQSSLAKRTTPATAAGVADHVWTLREIAALLD